MNFECIHIEARDLPDAWFQTVYSVLDKGKRFTIDRGSYASKERLEFDYITIQIKHPSVRPLLPEIPPQYGVPNPVDSKYLDQYLPYLMTGYIGHGEAYTYGQRLTRFPIPFLLENREIVLTEIDELKKLNIIFFDKEFQCLCLNQIELLIWTYKNKGQRNNQMTMQIAHPSDMLFQDPPCLRSIDTRLQFGELHFIVYFRSWDLWNGFPANLAAIQLLKEYIGSCIEVGDGEIIASSKGLHLYDHCFEIARCIRSGKQTT
jgi:thymidylate synthase